MRWRCLAALSELGPYVHKHPDELEAANLCKPRPPTPHPSSFPGLRCVRSKSPDSLDPVAVELRSGHGYGKQGIGAFRKTRPLSGQLLCSCINETSSNTREATASSAGTSAPKTSAWRPQHPQTLREHVGLHAHRLQGIPNTLIDGDNSRMIGIHHSSSWRQASLSPPALVSLSCLQLLHRWIGYAVVKGTTSHWTRCLQHSL